MTSGKIRYILAAVFAALFFATACGKSGSADEVREIQGAYAGTVTDTPAPTPTPGEERLVIENSGLLPIHTEKQKNALLAGYEKITEHAFGTRSFSAPEQVVISWKVENAKEEPNEYAVSFGREGEDSVQKYVTGENSISISNLLLGMKYVLTVGYEKTDGTGRAETTATFVTDDAPPRNLSVPGVENVRDIGGWTTLSGGKIRQEMVIRSGRLNKNQSEEITIKQEGIDVLLNTCGIKTEIDLRMDEIRTSSALGDSVTYINIPMSYNKELADLRVYDAEVKRIVELFADEANYPILLHCSVGTDRTGFVTWIINGLCGVSESDLAMDYVFSNFGNVTGYRTYAEVQETYVSVIKAFPGETLSEKIKAYLSEIGVSKESMDAIEKILVE